LGKVVADIHLELHTRRVRRHTLMEATQTHTPTGAHAPYLGAGKDLNSYLQIILFTSEGPPILINLGRALCGYAPQYLLVLGYSVPSNRVTSSGFLYKT
jgi:hypothetical protein